MQTVECEIRHVNFTVRFRMTTGAHTLFLSEKTFDREGVVAEQRNA